MHPLAKLFKTRRRHHDLAIAAQTQKHATGLIFLVGPRVESLGSTGETE